MRNLVASHSPLANICAFSTLSALSVSIPSSVIYRAVSPELFLNSTSPVVRLQHLDIFLKPLLVIRVSGVPLTENHEATKELMVRYIMILRVLIIFVWQVLDALQELEQFTLVGGSLPLLLSLNT